MNDYYNMIGIKYRSVNLMEFLIIMVMKNSNINDAAIHKIMKR